MMSKVMARVLSTMLALLLLLLPLGSLAEEAAGGDLFSMQISNISIQMPGAEAPITFLPVLTLAAGLDEAGERGILQLLLTVQETTAANAVVAYEDGLVKVYVENVASYIEIPVEQLEAMATSAMESEADLAGLPALDSFASYFEKFSDPEHAKALGQKFMAKFTEEYSSWYKGLAEIEQDGVKATVKEYEMTFGSMEEMGAYLDLFVGLDEGIDAMMQQLLALLNESTGGNAESFAEVYAQLGEEAKMSMTGTMYYDEANTVAGVDMQMTIGEAEGDAFAELTMSEKVTQIDEQNMHVAVSMNVVDLTNPENNGATLELDILTTGDGEAQTGEVSLAFTFLEAGEEVSMAFNGNSQKDASNYDFAGALNVLTQGMTIELSVSFDGDWAEQDGITVFSGPLQLALGGDIGEYALSADVVTAFQPLPAGQLLTTGIAGVNPLEMDEEALNGLAAEFQTALVSAMGALMQDPTLAAMIMGMSGTQG